MRASTDSEVVYVGADWDSEKCVVEYTCDGGRKRGTVRRHPDAVREFMQRFAGREVVVGMETGDRLFATLLEREGATVCVFDAKKAHHYARSRSSSGASDDRRSAETLLEMVQSPSHRADRIHEPTQEVRGSLRLIRAYEDASKQVVRLNNQIKSLLTQVHAAFALLKPDLSKAWVRRVLTTAPTPHAWNALTETQQNAALKGTRKALRPAIAAALGHDWGGVTSNEAWGAALQMQSKIRSYEHALQEKSQLERTLDEYSSRNEIAQMLREIPGIGPLLASGTAAAVTTPAQGKANRDHVAVQLGVAPVTVRSGVKGERNPLVSMRRSTDATMRNIGYLLAVQLVCRSPWAKAQYAHYKARGCDTGGAYRRVARSFSRIVQAMVRDGSRFDDELYVRRLKQKGVEWAMAL